MILSDMPSSVLSDPSTAVQVPAAQALMLQVEEDPVHPLPYLWGSLDFS